MRNSPIIYRQLDPVIFVWIYRPIRKPDSVIVNGTDPEYTKKSFKISRWMMLLLKKDSFQNSDQSLFWIGQLEKQKDRIPEKMYSNHYSCLANF